MELEQVISPLVFDHIEPSLIGANLLTPETYTWSDMLEKIYHDPKVKSGEVTGWKLLVVML